MPLASPNSSSLSVVACSVTSYTQTLLIDSSLNIIFPLISAEQCTKQGLIHIFVSVHHVNVVWKSKVFEIGEIPKAWLVGPGVFRIIAQEMPWMVRIRL